MPLSFRAHVLQALRTHTADALNTAELAAAVARRDATDEETRPENKYDTHSTEASYLAAGQARRVVALRLLQVFYDGLDDEDCEGDRMGLGRLCRIVRDADGTSRWVFLAPDGGGASVVVEGQTVQVTTPDSPLGTQLLDAEVDDDVTFPGRPDDPWILDAVR